MTHGQLGFGFDEDAPELAAQLSASRGRQRKAKATPPVAAASLTISATSPASDPERMALELERHPDYRVLRRLVPTVQFPDSIGPVATVVILDTETTGLDGSRDQIIELALLRLQVDRQTGLPAGQVQVYDGLRDPGMPVPKVARDITGITDAMLAGQALDMARIESLLGGADLVIAHNAGFDRPFVEGLLPQAQGLDWACSFADIDWTAAGHSSAKLAYLASSLGWFYDAHRAEIDCHALLRVLTADLPGVGANGLMHLLSSARMPSYRLQATGAPFGAKELLKTRGYRWDGQGKVWHVRLGGDAALQAECDWLRDAVYAGRAARLQWERHDAKSRYSTREGVMGWVQI